MCFAEPPVGGGYSYSSGGHGSFGGSGGGYSSSYASGFGGGYVGSGIGGDLSSFSGGDYHAVSSGHQTYEGQYVDPTLLHKVKEILLDHENLEESTRGHGGIGGFGGGYPSSTYGVPAPTYGVPHYNSRVVAIELGHINPSIQVAQYHQAGYSHTPSGSYGVPAIPSGSYGVPSSSYGVPH